MSSKQSAVQRMTDRLDGKRTTGKSPNYSAMTWNWNGLIEDARSWQAGKAVNWTDVAREYGVHEVLDVTKLANNGGQIVRAVLADAGIQTEQFLTSKGVQTGAPGARRSVHRTAAGTGVPQHTSVKQLQEQAKNKV